MFIDLHMHEMRYSKDSHLSLEEMVTIAKRRGLDAICITDHESMGLREFAAEYSVKTGFPIFVALNFIRCREIYWPLELRIIQRRGFRRRTL